MFGASSRQMAKGLAWFGIGLGLAEVVAPRRLARAAGVERHPHLVRLFGIREIASGVAILAARDPAPWLWIRVVGDALDGALLASGLASKPQRGRALRATLAVAPIVALDILHAPTSQADPAR